MHRIKELNFLTILDDFCTKVSQCSPQLERQYLTTLHRLCLFWNWEKKKKSVFQKCRLYLFIISIFLFFFSIFNSPKTKNLNFQIFLEMIWMVYSQKYLPKSKQVFYQNVNFQSQILFSKDQSSKIKFKYIQRLMKQIKSQIQITRASISKRASLYLLYYLFKLPFKQRPTNIGS